TKDLSRFSRGVVPAEEKDTVHLYADFGINLSPESAANGEPRAGGGALGSPGFRKSGEAVPGFAGAGPGVPGAAAPTGRVATSGVANDSNGDKTWYFKDRELPELRRARRVETPSLDAAAAAPQSQSRAARVQAESEMLKKPMAERTPVTEAKADSNNENVKVL